MTKYDFKESGFFVLRTPMLPVADYLGAASLGPEITDQRDFREALYLASPDLYAQLDYWRDHPETERGLRIQRSVIRYFARMCYRPTPFGLFAGCSVGHIGRQTRLQLAARDKIRRKSRLDMDYLADLLSWVGQNPDLQMEMTFRPNSSLYEVAGRWHYAEARTGDHGRRYHLVAVEKSEPLQQILESSRPGARLHDIAQSLVDYDDEIEFAEALAFIGELVECQILIADLALPVTGTGALQSIREYVGERPSFAQLHEHLSEIQAQLDAFDNDRQGSDPERYEEFAQKLQELPVPVKLNRMIQVDMFRPGVELELGVQPLQEIYRGVSLLHAISPPKQESALTRFCDQFSQRYGDAEIPLTEALDEEIGVGFMKSTAPAADGSPVLVGLPLVTDQKAKGHSWRPWHEFLLKNLTATLTEGRSEMELSEEDMRKYTNKSRQPLPGAFSVFASIASPSPAAQAEGNFQVHIMGAGGPSGARMLGRFCHLDQQLQDHVAAHLREEEAEHPDAIYAEIVHLPEGRTGNILSRPVLREYEIPFLGKADVDPDHQIPVTDLMVSVRAQQVVLRSQRLNRRVIPCLTSAHGFLGRNLGVYKFLACLQSQGIVGDCSWSWGPLESSPRLPRVTCGKLVLAKARWFLDRENIAALVDGVQSDDSSGAVERWRTSRGIPRMIELVEGDNRLLVDLGSDIGTDLLIDAIKGRAGAVLREVFPAPDQLIAEGEDGAYAHELIIPMVRTFADEKRSHPEPPAPRRQRNAARVGTQCFPPGSEWLYAKLYCGTATADRLLGELVAPLVQALKASGLISQWFFMRYGDPDWHIRLRFRGTPQDMAAGVLPAIQEATTAWLADRRLQRVQYDTYEREVARYGGPQGVELAEKMFQADSRAVLGIIQATAGDAGLGQRWRWALLGIDMLLDDLAFTLHEKQGVLESMRASFFTEFGGENSLHKELGLKFRHNRAELDNMLAGETRGDDQSGALYGLLLTRRQQWQNSVQKLVTRQEKDELTCSRTDLASSLAHMHVNRMMRSAARAHELVIYDFLCRLYRSRIARTPVDVAKTG